jgi:hypothetical protein
VFDGERNDSPSNLDCHGMECFQSQFVFEQYDGSELRGVVFDVEPVLFALDDSMAS